MLAKLVDEPYDRDGWLFEVKWDGYRTIAEIDHGDVALYSRNGLSFAMALDPIVKSLAKINRKAVLDGETIVLTAAADRASRAFFIGKMLSLTSTSTTYLATYVKAKAYSQRQAFEPRLFAQPKQ